MNLAALNSATKYPSIPTYHELDPKNGGLLETAMDFEGNVILTEKVDGTNGRIIFMPDGDWFIGSREELLFARGDRVGNPSQGIVDALRHLAWRLDDPQESFVTVFYLEVYGHKIGGQHKQYTAGGNVGYRMFDLAFIPAEVLDWERDKIASWRDHGGQRWALEATLRRAAEAEQIPLVPRIDIVPAVTLPATVEDTHEWLKANIPSSLVALDDGAAKRPEGIVLRSPDRAVIAKARFQDYERTLKRRTQGRR